MGSGVIRTSVWLVLYVQQWLNNLYHLKVLIWWCNTKINWDCCSRIRVVYQKNQTNHKIIQLSFRTTQLLFFHRWKLFIQTGSLFCKTSYSQSAGGRNNLSSWPESKIYCTCPTCAGFISETTTSPSAGVDVCLVQCVCVYRVALVNKGL